MRFSLIVSAYNQQDYLRECAESLLSQPVELEMVLVDDGSTDSTPAMCEEYAAKDPRVKVLHTKNGGTSAARNAGAAVAEGDYMIFIDGDDMLVEGCLERVDSVLKAHSDPDIVLCKIDRYIHETKEIKPYDGVEGLEDCTDIDDFAERLAVKRNRFSVSTCRYAINREFYFRKGLAFDNDVWHEDEHFTPLMINAADSVAVCDGGFYLYRRHEGSKVFTADIKNLLEFITVSKTLIKERNKGCSSKQKTDFLTVRANFLFSRGILEGITAKGNNVRAIKKAAVSAIDIDPAVMDDLPKLKKYVRVLGKNAGVGCFLRILKLKRSVAGKLKKE